MAKKMLIDATHAEETRVVVVDGTKVEEFDFESENKRQLAGNIYLAKVTRVEPSLQAAFVDYGGNRHGFLAFSEIHPDYYQIPVADREALLAEEKALAAAQEEEEEEGRRKPARRRRSRGRGRAAKAEANDAVAKEEITALDVVDLGEGEEDIEGSSPMELVGETPVETPAAGSEEERLENPENPEDGAAEGEAVSAADEVKAGEGAEESAGEEEETADDEIEAVADDDSPEEIRPPRKPRPRRYKIQEVIKVRQIMLVQVVKEERGNKGAALTTYLSLAGRYCVLMPNTARGGGISRKITNPADRKKLKQIANEIKVPEGAGLIIRTAGAKRTKAEIKRDYEYLQRLWEQIRELTLKSIAPAKIYEEGNLIKRSIRDLYNREIDEVLVEGEEGYRTAKDFMKMIMPSHAKNVKQYTDPLPLFARYQVESYLAGMFNPTVQLKSGGYIVIGVTEALVAIDVNSGRSTKEGSIEETALKTNLEAAEEVARQLRLRDLAGLIVIDFIDMDERRNNLAVEKRLKEALKHDRARIQVGRISGFGLLEMSRQRLRPGMIETTTQLCSHCHGTGLIRSDDNLALSILRQIEEEGVRRRSREVLLKAPVGIINFLMNNKREHIAHIEERYGLSVRLEADPSLVSPDFSLEKFKTATRVVAPPSAEVVSIDASIMEPVEEAETIEEASEAEEAQAQPKKRRRRRRRRRGGAGSGEGAAEAAPEAASEAAPEAMPEAASEAESGADTGEGGGAVAADQVSASEQADAGEAALQGEEPSPEEVEEKPKKRRAARRRKKVAAEEAAPATEEAATEPAEAAGKAGEDAPEPEEAPKRKRTRRRKAAKPVDEGAGGEEPRADASGAEAADTDAAAESAEPGDRGEPAEGAEKPVKKKPAPRRRSRKKAVPEAEPEKAEGEKAAEERASEEKTAEEAAEKAPIVAGEDSSAAAPAHEPAGDNAANGEPVASVSEGGSSEDRSADVPVAADEAADTGQTDQAEKPKKKGWWAFGG